jgi:hypothetical protein
VEDSAPEGIRAVQIRLVLKPIKDQASQLLANLGDKQVIQAIADDLTRYGGGSGLLGDKPSSAGAVVLGAIISQQFHLEFGNLPASSTSAMWRPWTANTSPSDFLPATAHTASMPLSVGRVFQTLCTVL